MRMRHAGLPSGSGVSVGYASTMRRIMVGTLIAAFALAGSGAIATAAPNVVDQYTEQVPGPGGEKPSEKVQWTDRSNSGSDANMSVGQGDIGSGSGGGSGAATNGPSTNSGGSAGRGANAGSSMGGQSAQEMNTNSDSSGMGWLFPAILVTATALLAVVAFSRRRRAEIGM